MTTELWAHQRQALDFIADKPAAMLAMAMGTGKSRVVIERIMADPNIKRVLITCPLSVVQVWRQQFEQHAHGRRVVVVPLDEGTVAKRAARAKYELDRARLTPDVVLVLVINHESVWRPPFGPVYDPRTNRITDGGLALGTWWDLVVADESHRLKAPGGKFSRFLARVRDRSSRRLALTGTPMPHSPLDLYAQFRFLDTTVFGTSFQAFRSRYAEMGGFQDHEIKRFIRQDEMNARFRRLAYQVGADVLDLPDAVHVERYCTLSPRGQRIYSDLERQFYSEVESGTVTPANALVRLLRLRQVTSGHVRNDDGELVAVDGAKAALLEDVLEDIGQREPVVVFCQFRPDLATVQAICEAQGRRYGEVSGEAKDLDGGRFPPDVDVLGVQIQAGGVGIDLTRARYAIYYSIGFSLGDYEQSLARVHRPGQHRPVTYIHLLAAKTIDKIVYQALQKRRNVIDEVLYYRRKEAA